MLNAYLEELKRIKLLSREEELRLWQESRAGNPEAHHRLVSSYQPLVFKIAAGFRLPESQLSELIQEGTVGLLEAAERFDHTKGIAFSLFAVHRIRGRMLDYLKRENLVRTLSLDSETAEGSGISWAECLVSGAVSPDESVERDFLFRRVHEAMERLTANEQKVLTGIYLDERTAGELAADIMVTPGHVYRLQKKAVRKVRGMLSRLMADLKKS